MNISILESMWSKIAASLNDTRDLKVLRFPTECIPQMFLGLDTEGKRCLLLMVDAAPDIPADGHENLSLSYLSDSNSDYIAIRLDNDFFSDLFNDYISSVFDLISQRENDPELPKEFIRIFLRWCEFFDSLTARELSFEALQGLFGELTYLGDILHVAQPASVNEVLSSWTGPFHSKTDFTLPDKLVEVKAISNASKQVKISSEYQLEEEPGLGLELTVRLVDDIELKPLT